MKESGGERAQERISVVLPVFNIEDYLPRCMESLARQTYQNLEILLIDDGSEEACALLCDSYADGERVKVFHKENGGLSDARNYGVQRASGTYLTFIDPDDYVDDDYLEYLYGLLRRHGTLMSICQHRVCFSDGKVQDFGTSGEECLSSEQCLERMLYHDVIDTSAWAKLYHRDLCQKIQYPKGRIFEDIATTYRFMMASGMIAVGYESKYNYMFRPNSIVNSRFDDRKLDLLAMTDRMAQDVGKAFPGLRRAVLRRQVYARFSTLNQMAGVRGRSETKSELIRYIRVNARTVLSDPKCPQRDRIALQLIRVSYSLYRVCWSVYLKIDK